MLRPQSYTITNIFDLILKIFIFTLPIAYFPGISQYGFRALIFSNMAMAIFAMTFFMEKRRSSTNLLLPTVALLSLMVSLIKAPTGLSTYVLNILFATILYKAVVENVEDIEGICNLFLWCGAINIVFVIFQLFGHDLIYVINPDLDWQKMLLSHSGLMSRNYHLSWYIAMCLPLAFYKNRLLGILFLVLLVIQHSFAGFLGAFVGLTLYFSDRMRVTKKNLIVLALLLPLVFMMITKYDYGNLRLRAAIWMFLSRDILVNPFFGYGLGMFDKIFLGDLVSANRQYPIIVISSYSQYIKQIAEHGFFPVIIILAVLFRMIKKWFIVANWDRLTKALLCGWISLLVVMIFHEALQYTHLVITFLMLMALCEARIKQITCKEN